MHPPQFYCFENQEVQGPLQQVHSVFAHNLS
jgi:hypothetical protein